MTDEEKKQYEEIQRKRHEEEQKNKTEP
jgi:hypothetical protein